jgi:hypothetical protein
MKTGARQITRLLLGLAAIVAVVLILNLLVAQPGESGKRVGLPAGSTYSALFDGTELLYSMFESLGFEVQRHHYPLVGNYISSDGVDVIWHSKGRVPVDQEEVDWIDLWVVDGGTLVLVNEPSQKDDTTYEEFSFNVDDALIDRWLDRIGMAEIFSEVIDIAGRAGAGNRRLLAGEPTDMALGEIGQIVTYEHHASGIPSVARFILREEREPEVRRVIRDSHGTVLAFIQWGRGQVWLVSDIYVFSNMLLQDADNAPVAVSMVLDSRGGDHSRVLFDEYHLGFVQTRTFNDAARTPVGKTLIYLAIVAAIAVATAGARFGRPRRASSPIGVSQRAFVRALAGMWQAAGATSAAADALWRRYRGKRSVVHQGMDVVLDGMRKGKPTRDSLLSIARRLDP